MVKNMYITRRKVAFLGAVTTAVAIATRKKPPQGKPVSARTSPPQMSTDPEYSPSMLRHDHRVASNTSVHHSPAVAAAMRTQQNKEAQRTGFSGRASEHHFTAWATGVETTETGEIKGKGGFSIMHSPDIPHRPVLDLSVIDPAVVRSYEKHQAWRAPEGKPGEDDYIPANHNYQRHITLMIPAYAESHQYLTHAILRTFPEGAEVMDIGASDSPVAKMLAECSRGKIHVTCLDSNPSMAAEFRKGEVPPGIDYRVEALSHSSVEGELAWPGISDIKNFKPTHPVNILMTAVTFQFMGINREEQVARAKQLMTPDGIAVFTEKFIPELGDVESKREYTDNERTKNNFQKYYITTHAVQEDEDKVIAEMSKTQVTQGSFEATLGKNFKYVVQVMDSGNFKTYIGSDSKEQLDKFMNNLPTMNSDYNTVINTTTGEKVQMPRVVKTQK